MNHKHTEYRPTNREKSKQSKLGLFWCRRCDRSLIGQIGKCKVCGYRSNRKKIK